MKQYIEHLNQITPELVAEMENAVLEDQMDVAPHYDCVYRWQTLAGEHRHLIIAALHAALRLNRELSSTTRDES